MAEPATKKVQRASRPSDGRRVAVLLAIAGVLLAVIALRLYVGSSMTGYPDGPLWGYYWAERWHRLWLGLIVGAALAIGGVALQALLRNALAEPFILGLSTGAGAGIMVQWLIVHELAEAAGRVAQLPPSHTGALGGAAASMAVVYLASRRRGGLDPLSLLLTGVVLSTINGALIMVFYYLAGPGGVKEDLSRWMMGFLDTGHGSATIVGVGTVTALGLFVLLGHGRAMDAATLSDDEAQSVGVNLPRLRGVLFIAASALAAGAVVLAGPIAFVGLICPHVARLLLGPSHTTLLIASAMLGAALVIAADTAAAFLAQTTGIGVMPIGIFTALIGGPTFLWMLRSPAARDAG